MSKSLLTLKTQVDKNSQDIKELQKDIKDLASAVKNLSFELQRNSENDFHEREKLALRVQNALLKIENRFLLKGNDDGNAD